MADPSFKRSLADVPDILPDIFSYLDPIHYSDERMYQARRSLAMAARSCRDFAGPALDALWRPPPKSAHHAEVRSIRGLVNEFVNCVLYTERAVKFPCDSAQCAVSSFLYASTIHVQCYSA